MDPWKVKKRRDFSTMESQSPIVSDIFRSHVWRFLDLSGAVAKSVKESEKGRGIFVAYLVAKMVVIVTSS